MLKYAVLALLVCAPFSKAQSDPYEVCVGQEDGTQLAYGHQFSCTKYFSCESEYGYEEDCVEQYGEGYEFNEDTLQCDYSDYVNCEANSITDEPYPDPDPVTDPPAPPPPIITQAPITQAPATPAPPVVTPPPATTSGPSIPDITCPTNRPGEILFFPSSNCTEYFICASGIRLSMACMEGFAWNQDLKQCDYPIFSPCSVRIFLVNVEKIIVSFLSQQNIVDDGMNVRCTRDGFYTTAYPRNCEKFVFCSLGIPMVQNCPVGHAWSLDRCVVRKFANCPDLRRLL